METACNINPLSFIGYRHCCGKIASIEVPPVQDPRIRLLKRRTCLKCDSVLAAFFICVLCCLDDFAAGSAACVTHSACIVHQPPSTSTYLHQHRVLAAMTPWQPQHPSVVPTMRARQFTVGRLGSMQVPSCANRACHVIAYCRGVGAP